MASWGIALSGGGLLGAAHLGVWRAFEEMGMRPGFFAGTSAGGLVVPLWAGKVPWDRVDEAARQITLHPERYFTLPIGRILLGWCGWGSARRPPLAGILRTDRFLSRLLSLLPFHSLDELQAPVVLTAVDLAGLQAVAFVGRPTPSMLAPPRWRVEPFAPLSLAMHATMSTPGIFEPAFTPASVLVDGGVADTLPIDWAAHLGADRVIGVDVAPARSQNPRTMGLGEVLSRTEHYMTETLAVLRDPPHVPRLILKVPTESIGSLNFRAYPELVRLGYDTVRAEQSTIREFLTAPDNRGWLNYGQNRVQNR